MGDRLIVTTMRNEAPFLLEWIAHHRLIGFTHVLLYTNGCEDGTDRMAARLADLGLLTHVPNDAYDKNGPQWSALADAWARPEVRRTEWVMVADADEFLAIRAGDGTLDALLEAAGPADLIALPWRFFGNAGVAHFADRPVTAQFVDAAPFPLAYPFLGSMVKTLFRPRPHVQKLGVHIPRLKPTPEARAARWVNGSGQPLGPGFDPGEPFVAPSLTGNALAQVNHYALRSAESFLVKSDRGLPNRRSRAIDVEYWVKRNFADEADPVLARLAPALAAKLAELKADEALGRLHAEGCAWHRARAAALRDTAEGHALFAACLMAGPSRVPPPGLIRALYRSQRVAMAAARRAAG